MSSPMSRTISRPFGRPAATASSSSAPWPQTQSSASAPSYVLRDAPEDTPHDIHPHAAAYVTAQQAQPGPDAPTRTRTLRQMTPAERAAWMSLQELQPAYVAATAEANTASSASAPSAQEAAPPGHGRLSQSWGATNAYQPTPPTSPPLPSPPQVDVEMTYSTPSAPAQVMTPPPATPSAASRPVRTSSLQAGPASRALAALTGAGSAPRAGATPELEIVISRAGGQDITLRLYAPAPI